MGPALPDENDLLTPHRVGPSTTEVIQERLHCTGLIVLEGLSSRAAVVDLALDIMTILPHRDSDLDGLTTLHNTGYRGARPGFGGFTGDALAPHTERSGIPAPPRLMLLVCGRAADQGGDCLLTDGRAVHDELWAHHPEAARALSQPRTAFFGTGDGAGGGHATQVFTKHPGGRWSVRLRTDQLARWSPLTQPYLPTLHTAVAAHQVPLRLTAGQGYLLDNTRWLHARAAFTGPRLCWRALGEPRFSLPPGFAGADPARAGAGHTGWSPLELTPIYSDLARGWPIPHP